ncbi:hypothetical protein B296_00013795 [Ensete ventricosum]|uniref:Uncharacterized protein n=1 Tax=Ensete ventricosum TaxID=4639 RepID=A0A426ZBK8_ENSVE|nr:hypothetical protein B296_00013795 [Ensete ventricosum]
MRSGSAVSATMQWYNYNRRKMGQWCAQLLRRRAIAIWSERPLLVMFNSLLAAIKIVGSERSLRAAM